MNFRAIMPLTVLVALLALWVFYLDKPPEGRDDLEADVLWKLETDNMERLVFRKGPDVIDAWRDGGRWTVDSIPKESEVFVDSLLKNLCRTLSRIPVLMEMESAHSVLDRYGLQNPKMEVEVFLVQEPEPRRLFFGDPNPRNTARYARSDVAPEKVVLLGSLLYWEIDESLQSMKRLLHAKPDVTGFETGL